MARQSRKPNVNLEDGRDAVFLHIIRELQEYTDYGKRGIAKEARVHWTTLYYWVSGRTTKPRIDTLCRVAYALGFDIVLSRRNTARLRLVK